MAVTAVAAGMKRVNKDLGDRGDVLATAAVVGSCWPMVRRSWSVVWGDWSVVRGSWPMVRGGWSVVGGGWSMMWGVVR